MGPSTAPLPPGVGALVPNRALMGPVSGLEAQGSSPVSPLYGALSTLSTVPRCCWHRGTTMQGWQPAHSSHVSHGEAEARGLM